MMTACVNPMNS